MQPKPNESGKLDSDRSDFKSVQPPADDDAYELADPLPHQQKAGKSAADDDDAYELAEPGPSVSAGPVMPLISAGKPRLPAAKSSRGLKIAVTGHILAPVLGLAIGYYIMCWLAPHANVLSLPLPGLEATAPAPSPISP